MLRRRSRKWNKKKHGSKQEGSKTDKEQRILQVFLRREKQEETETTKEHYSPWRTNKQETVSFEKKETAQKEQFKKKTIAFLWRRERM